MTRHIKQQVFSHHTHQVDTCVAHVIFRVIFAKARTHVAVDRIQTLCHRARAVDVGLFSDYDFLVLSPVSGFEGSTGTTQARTTDKYVDIVFDNSIDFH